MSTRNMISNDEKVVSEYNQSYKNKRAAPGNDCFYNLCEKSTYWDGWMVCGNFKKRNHVIFCTFLTIMIFSLCLAVIAPLVLYSMADDSINSEVVIDSTSAVNYESWQTNAQGSGFDDVKVKYDLYYFDVQNGPDILRGAQPVVVEVGPYSYDEYYVKFDIVWTDGGDTVTYNTQKYYLFNQANSGPGLHEDDQLTVPYATAVGFQYLLGTLPPELAGAVDYFVYFELTQIYATIEKNLTDIYNSFPAKVAKFDPVRAEIVAINNTINMLFERMFAFVAVSSGVDLFYKTLLCNTPDGVTPFFKTDPSHGWFGWHNDPLLLQVQALLDVYAPTEPWTSSVPGAAFNWTSIEETRRRRLPDTFKTGKKNKNQVAQYVRFNGMDLDKYHVCVTPADSQDPTQYTEGEQFAACAYFDNTWTAKQIDDAGYKRPFATDYANRIAGTDANMYGRPVRSDKVQVFVSDIYRSAYLEHQGDVDWHGVPLRRYGLQEKDMLNAWANPENAQYYNYAPSGLENTTQAAGAPVFVSFPHFLMGDPVLVAAVKGISPNMERHQTYIDIEPQTGLLARAAKKLQVNYQLLPYHKMAQTDDDTLVIANSICANITELEAAVAPLMDDPTVLPTLNCNSLIVEGLFTCLNQYSDWNFQDDGIYMPFGWANEQMALPDSTADDLNNSLFLVDDLAEEIRFWCLIIAGISFAVLLAMVVNSYCAAKDTRSEAKRRAFADGGMMVTTEPLLVHGHASAPPGSSFSS